MRGTLVIISSIHWHSTWQRHQDIAAGLARHGYRVIFVEPLPKRWPGAHEWQRVMGRIFGSSQASGYCRQPEPDGVSIVTPRVLPDVGRVGQEANARFFVPRLADELRQMGLERPLVVVNYLPTAASIALQQALQPDLAVYDCVTDWASAPLTESLARYEEQLLQISDLVFADSPNLLAKMRKRHDHVHEVLPAVHFERFQLPPRGEVDAAEAERPLCVYFGTIGYNLDLDLLRAVSRRFPLRLIGPLRRKLDGLSPTTELHGSVPHDQIPALLRDANVLLLPYDRVPHTPAIIPAKTFECLATGIPTVAIGLNSLEKYADLFYLAETPEAFLTRIEEASAEDGKQRADRIACARANSWEQRITEIAQYIEDGLASARRQPEPVPQAEPEPGS